MCFSAEASFSAAALLGGAAFFTLKNAPNRSFFFLAAIPFLFAMQQLSEGILWVNLKSNSPSDITSLAAHSFLFFAFLVWPVWIPLSLWLVEKNQKNKKVIFVILVGGTLLSLFNLYFGLQDKISVATVNRSLQYTGNVPPQTYFYPLIILLPCFLSTLRSIRPFAFLIAAAYAVAFYFYRESFVSVWCFFSALVSLFIFKVIKENQPETKGNRGELPN